MQHDVRGNALSGASAQSLTHYETAAHLFSLYIGDPVASIDAALAASPDFIMAHALKAYLHLVGTEPAGWPVARACLAAASGKPATRREAMHLAAIGHIVEGRWREGARVLEDIAIENPRDLLAVQTGHLFDFLLADSRMLRDRVARALPAWSDSTPGYHAMLGMHAFGLEETGLYAQAEKSGRRAVEIEPRDGWGQHAVAHVYEMQNRTADGIAWMEGSSGVWSHESFFAIHNWWHLALYHLEGGDIGKVLALFDGPIHGARSGLAFDLVDATAMLWRLHLRGVDVGDRWQRVADGWEPLADAGHYAFNDAHAAMAFAGAGRPQSLARIMEAQRQAMARGGDNAGFTREVGAPVVQAVAAFGEQRYGETTALLRGVRNIANRFGGSHAQRDILDLTLIEAALRGGNQPLAAALSAERAAMRPQSPLSRLFQQRATQQLQAA